jgi:hypothetical protein
VRYLVLDIEAVRDPNVWTPPAEPPQPGREHFPPPFGWRTLVVGCVMLEEREPAGVLDVKKVGAIEAPADVALEERERMVLEKFADVAARAPEFVTWNGRHFDLPVLMLRSMRFGMQHPKYFSSRETRYRYTEAGHCDLADAMADFGAADRLKLDGMAKLIGLPGKFGDIDGAGVEAAFAAGRLADITRYCISDAAQTAFLFMRWWLLKGHFDLNQYRESAAGLLAACEDHGGLADFVARVDRRVLLLENNEKGA